jgi:CBS domain-containing protein
MMRELNIGCLPIVKGRKLIGLITAHDFLTVSAKVLEEKLIALSASRSLFGGKSNEYSAKAA